MLKRMTKHGLTPGLAMDLTTNDPDDGKPWDFDVKDKRDKALRLQRGQKPLFTNGSPMCTRERLAGERPGLPSAVTRLDGALP